MALMKSSSKPAINNSVSLFHRHGSGAAFAPPLLLVPLLLMPLLLVPRLALAASEEGGLPQLDFTTWPTQVFWLVVSFGLAYLLMWRFVVPSIGSVLEERHNKIEDDLKRAKQAADDAEEARTGFETLLAEARRQAGDKMRESADAVAKKMDRRIATSMTNLLKKAEAAEAEVAEAKRNALKDVGDMATMAAIEMADRLAGVKVGKADAKRHIKVAEKALG